MTAMSTELWALVPATSLVEDTDFSVLAGRQCEISFHIEGSDSEPLRIDLVFDGVEAFKCTYLTSCTAEMFNLAYEKLVCLGKTQWLSELLKAYHGGEPADELKHLMICFDDGPCYEFICRNFAERRSG
jgi:hypothetical protein